VILDHAAYTGLDPYPLTLRELADAAEFCSRERWDHTSCLRADIINSAMGRKRKVKPSDLHPHRNRQPTKRLTREESRKLLDNALRGN
jgi:hypothetical protein